MLNCPCGHCPARQNNLLCMLRIQDGFASPARGFPGPTLKGPFLFLPTRERKIYSTTFSCVRLSTELLLNTAFRLRLKFRACTLHCTNWEILRDSQALAFVCRLYKWAVVLAWSFSFCCCCTLAVGSLLVDLWAVQLLLRSLKPLGSYFSIDEKYAKI